MKPLSFTLRKQLACITVDPTAFILCTSILTDLCSRSSSFTAHDNDSLGSNSCESAKDMTAGLGNPVGPTSSSFCQSVKHCVRWSACKAHDNDSLGSNSCESAKGMTAGSDNPVSTSIHDGKRRTLPLLSTSSSSSQSLKHCVVRCSLALLCRSRQRFT